MTIGLGVFIACDVLGLVLAVIGCRRTRRERGQGMAIAEAVVMALSLAAYTGTCLWLGFGPGAQCLGLAASAVPVLTGAIFVPSVRDQLRGNR